MSLQNRKASGPVSALIPTRRQSHSHPANSGFNINLSRNRDKLSQLRFASLLKSYFETVYIFLQAESKMSCRKSKNC
jgi:hypothetical protein